jgi:DNA mismatch repair protein MutH
MKLDQYNKESPKSIYEHSLKLVGKNLRQCTNLPEKLTNSRNRGDLGSLVETYFFKHNPPNTHEPDFPEAGIELKTTGLESYKRPTRELRNLKAKERLVLTSINYKTIINEDWETSSFINKCNLMLIMFYDYDSDLSVIDQQFSIQPLLLVLDENLLKDSQIERDYILRKGLVLSKSDICQIQRDWEFIRKKIKDKKAHELSEGDTNYLKACRKGSGGADEPLRKQLGSEVGAKSRAFSLKQSFLTQLIHGHRENLVSIGAGQDFSLEESTELKFAPFLGLSIEDIEIKLNYTTSSKHKKWLLANRMLTNSGKKVAEFEKAGIQLKTISINENERVIEDMSFPAFTSAEIRNQSWDESDFASQIEGRFLFVVYKKYADGVDRLLKVKFWNMPIQDRLEARRVWENTKNRLAIDPMDLTRKMESKVSHVRPHARNSKDYDESLLPLKVVKRCFWLNSKYLKEIVIPEL